MSEQVEKGHGGEGGKRFLNKTKKQGEVKTALRESSQTRRATKQKNS